MKPETVFVDVQGFRNCNNEFIIKEIGIATTEWTQTFLIKPPYMFSTLSLDEKKQTIWLEKNRGIRWSEGFVDYREFKRIINPTNIIKADVCVCVCYDITQKRLIRLT